MPQTARSLGGGPAAWAHRRELAGGGTYGAGHAQLSRARNLWRQLVIYPSDR